MKLTKIAGALLSLSILAGCSSSDHGIPKDVTNPLPEIYDQVVSEWKQQEDPITFIDSNTDFLIEKRKPIPSKIKNIHVENLKLYNATFDDLIFALKGYGINIYVSNSDGKDSSIGSGNITINDFSGTVGELFEIVEKIHNVSFNYQSKNNIILEKNTLFISPVPQDEDAAKDLVESLKNLGAQDATYSLSSGFMVYKASNKDYETISEYLEHYYKNFATIKLQVAVITVNMSKDHNTGFDWGQLQSTVGNLALLASSPVTDGAKEIVKGTVAALDSNSLGATVKGSDFDIKAVFNLLSQYGKTTASQSIFLETISGKQLKLVNSREVPYTSNINSSISSNDGSTTASGFSTETEQEGMNVSFSPYFNYAKNTVTLALELDLKTITGFKQLNAGNGNGTVEQPETQNQKFNSVVEIIPGSAHLVGGIMYDLEKDNRQNLNILDDFDTASRKHSKSKNALFILLRPTVTIYSDFKSNDGEN